jgi:hypothetical protein
VPSGAQESLPGARDQLDCETHYLHRVLVRGTSEPTQSASMKTLRRFNVDSGLALFGRSSCGVAVAAFDRHAPAVSGRCGSLWMDRVASEVLARSAVFDILFAPSREQKSTALVTARVYYCRT